jgi:hypothetical protein
VGLGFPLICLCECGLNLQQQMLGKELKGRVIGPMGTCKKKPIALVGGSKEKPNVQQVSTFDISFFILIFYDENSLHKLLL